MRVVPISVDLNSYAPPNSGIPCTLEMPVLERELQHKNATRTKRMPEPQLQQHVFSVTEIPLMMLVFSVPVSAQHLENPSTDPENQWSALAPATGLSSLPIGVLLLNRRRNRKIRTTHRLNHGPRLPRSYARRKRATIKPDPTHLQRSATVDIAPKPGPLSALQMPNLVL